jgi:histidyl-tRNA synthetase
MTQDKGLDPAVADRIGEYVKLNGGRELVAQLQEDAVLMANKRANAGLADMKLFFEYLEAMGAAEHVRLDRAPLRPRGC